MSQSPEPQRLFRWLPPLWVVGLLCLYLVGVSLAIPALGFLMGFPDEGFDVFALPVLEEVLKLWLVLKFSEHAFGAIVTFGVLELLLVKAPIVLEFHWTNEMLLLGTASLIGLGFHIATALAYKLGVGLGSHYVIFGACVALHILFNSLSLVDLHPGVWSLSAIVICVLVVASGRLVAFASRRTSRI